MHYHKPSLTIGIPAYNEEKNIGFLLDDLKKQKAQAYTLEKIIVISDGSTDGTVHKVSKSSLSNIHLIINKKRSGLARVQNQIHSMANSEILLVLQSDLRLPQTDFIEKIISPIIRHSADLVVPNVIETEPNTFFGRVLHLSTQIKNAAFEELNSGNNIYTCRGLARAFSRKLYKKIHFNKSIGEDAYTYMYCRVHGYKYVFLKDLRVRFRLPETFSDHSRQSLRFMQAKQELASEFGVKAVEQSFHIPFYFLLKSAVVPILKHPIHASSYIFVYFYLKIASYFKKSSHDMWEVAVSSKAI